MKQRITLTVESRDANFILATQMSLKALALGLDEQRPLAERRDETLRVAVELEEVTRD